MAVTLSKLLTGAAAFACVLALSAWFTPAARAAGGGGGGAGASPAPGNSGQAADPAESYRRGVAALEAREYREAIRQFRIVQRAAPTDGGVNYALGLAYVGNGDHAAARRPLERAVAADDAPLAARLQLGLVLLELGDRAKAVEQQTALAGLLAACDASCDAARRAQLQAVHDALTRALAPPAEAAPAADPAVTGWNFPSAHEGRLAYAAAVGLINTERYGEGLDSLARAQAAIGPHPDVLNYMGFANRRLGRYDAALDYYRAALRLDPDHLGANEYLGELYLQMGRIDEARRQLARLDRLCAYGCAQREELARWIELASN